MPHGRVRTWGFSLSLALSPSHSFSAQDIRSYRSRDTQFLLLHISIAQSRSRTSPPKSARHFEQSASLMCRMKTWIEARAYSSHVFGFLSTPESYHRIRLIFQQLPRAKNLNVPYNWPVQLPTTPVPVSKLVPPCAPC